MKSYTYIIKWSDHDKSYYGLRTANTLPPEEDLWNVYYTSSVYVKEYREKYGEPDVLIIDKVFDDRDSAVEYENSFIRENSLHLKDEWLNKAAFPVFNRLGYVTSDETKGKISKSKMGKRLSVSHRNKISESLKSLKRHQTEHQKKVAREVNSGRVLSVETKNKIAEAQREIASKTVTCPHCGHTGNGPVMRRWHMSNCKHL